MVLSNTAVPKYYGQFREAVMRGDIVVNEFISLEMNRIDANIANPVFITMTKQLWLLLSIAENESIRRSI